MIFEIILAVCIFGLLGIFFYLGYDYGRRKERTSLVKTVFEPWIEDIRVHRQCYAEVEVYDRAFTRFLGSKVDGPAVTYNYLKVVV